MRILIVIPAQAGIQDYFVSCWQGQGVVFENCVVCVIADIETPLLILFVIANPD